jgi:hypothetical protein
MASLFAPSAGQNRGSSVEALAHSIGRFPLLFLSLLLLAGCAVNFVAAYDETTDRLLTDLSLKTETAVVRADSGQLSAAERDKFYEESLGTVRALKARSALFAKNEDEISALGTLEENYDALRKRGAPPRSSFTTGLRRSLFNKFRSRRSGARSSAPVLRKPAQVHRPCRQSISPN